MILINASPKNALKIFQPFLPIYVPIGAACLVSAMETKGIKAYLIDQQVEDDIVGLVAKYIPDLKPPYVFGFSVLTIALKSALICARSLKRLYPDSLIVFGGIHPTAMPEEVLSHAEVDFVVRGEGEEALAELYRAVKTRKDFSSIGNLSFRRDGKVVHVPMKPLPGDLDDYPPFPYELFAHNKRYDLGFLISSRGCPYRCIFCSNRIVTGRRYKFKSAHLIAEELDMLFHRYHQAHIQFLDDNFLVHKSRVYELLEEICRRGLDKKMTFNFQARGDNVEPQMLKDLYEAGFRNIFFGLETSSDRLMKTIQKDETVAQCVAGVKMAKEIGLEVSATFIYGLPGETHEDRMGCVKLTRELKLDRVRYNNATPYPGTKLYEMAKAENRLNVQGIYDNFLSTSTFIENPFEKIPFSYVPAGNTEDEIRRDLLFSYFSFYLSLSTLKDVFLRSKQNAGWFDAGEGVGEILVKVPAILFLGCMLVYKFFQLFYFMVLNPKTATSFRDWLRIFSR